MRNYPIPGDEEDYEAWEDAEDLYIEECHEREMDYRYDD